MERRIECGWRRSCSHSIGDPYSYLETVFHLATMERNKAKERKGDSVHLGV